MGVKELGQSYDQPDKVIGKNENLLHQAKCASIVGIYPRKTPLKILAGIRLDSGGTSTC